MIEKKELRKGILLRRTTDGVFFSRGGIFTSKRVESMNIGNSWISVEESPFQSHIRDWELVPNYGSFSIGDLVTTTADYGEHKKGTIEGFVRDKDEIFAIIGDEEIPLLHLQKKEIEEIEEIDRYKVVKPFGFSEIIDKKPCMREFKKFVAEMHRFDFKITNISELKTFDTAVRNLSWLEREGFIETRKIKTELKVGTILEDGRTSFMVVSSGNGFKWNRICLYVPETKAIWRMGKSFKEGITLEELNKIEGYNFKIKSI